MNFRAVVANLAMMKTQDLLFDQPHTDDFHQW
jgi:hypothetical protein